MYCCALELYLESIRKWCQKIPDTVISLTFIQHCWASLCTCIILVSPEITCICLCCMTKLLHIPMCNEQSPCFIIPWTWHHSEMGMKYLICNEGILGLKSSCTYIIEKCVVNKYYIYDHNIHPGVFFCPACCSTFQQILHFVTFTSEQLVEQLNGSKNPQNSFHQNDWCIFAYLSFSSLPLHTDVRTFVQYPSVLLRLLLWSHLQTKIHSFVAKSLPESYFTTHGSQILFLGVWAASYQLLNLEMARL